MPNYNKVILMGHVTRDPQARYTPGGTAVTEVGLAVNRHWTDSNGQKQEDTTFVDVTFWAKSAELITELGVSKGDPFHIDGRLQLDQWQDKESGQNRSKLKVVGENFQILKPKSGNQGGNRGGQYQPGNQGQGYQNGNQGGNQQGQAFDGDLPY